MKSPVSCTIQVPVQLPLHRPKEMWSTRVNPLLHFKFVNCSFFSMQEVSSVITCAEKARRTVVNDTNSPEDVCEYGSFDRKSTKMVRKMGKKEHHLWQKRDSARSGQKALNLVRNISGLPNEKEAVYGALDKWIAWEAEFPLIAAAKALRILRKKGQWVRVIQVAKWMLSKGQGTTMTTYDSLLLAFDMDCRIDEAERLWNMILHIHTRSTSKKLFSRMISLYDHHNMPDNVIEVFADMEELGIKPDEDSLRKIARAFGTLGQVDKKKLVLDRYQGKWKYIHFNGERVRVRRIHCDE
ncbi:pentatricopeptide repeat-containing protein At4g18975, chloroplastic-like isoform X1 [Coffea eugenioides]|uniref:pentatricopeptide repeat-containing protein At4g18975, chloroplastic-like isoform X1 n=1 Tax=Coffea eugenioides TaxID=49369 RepID=UPI000F61124D|nr:pentatricopeptide repeat-containing protein At4g18975, chloroplastic-like isoform X1 [Coffea eugenioides]XP_027180590.1 pentatricopeptide repeat-containing protein At4g18975, chloroplastic-like isoform X1 [Coffea eugenioides]XP_027180591.1 pentatricopeptide repeat-containing protein At4g18975, chloroplastic-like isoform X1 [Coffea eugenioides]XP_027184446.1 pentatricopeptide repeat-containing protein At4g18975, chloroplastic-like isoform X1 [Coffea eugenioides]XP_027184447.1 pentatricopeptid